MVNKVLTYLIVFLFLISCILEREVVFVKRGQIPYEIEQRIQSIIKDPDSFPKKLLMVYNGWEYKMTIKDSVHYSGVARQIK